MKIGNVRTYTIYYNVNSKIKNNSDKSPSTMIRTIISALTPWAFHEQQQ